MRVIIGTTVQYRYKQYSNIYLPVSQKRFLLVLLVTSYPPPTFFVPIESVFEGIIVPGIRASAAPFRWKCHRNVTGRVCSAAGADSNVAVVSACTYNASICQHLTASTVGAGGRPYKGERRPAGYREPTRRAWFNRCSIR